MLRLAIQRFPFERLHRPLLVHHVARMCKIAPRTVRWNANCGRLRGFREPSTPKIWRFWPEDVEEFRRRRLSCTS